MTIDYTKVGEQMSKTASKPKPASEHQPTKQFRPEREKQPYTQDDVERFKKIASSINFKEISAGKKVFYIFLVLLCVTYPVLFIPVAIYFFATKGNAKGKKLDFTASNPKMQNMVDNLTSHIPEELLDEINQKIKERDRDKNR